MIPCSIWEKTFINIFKGQLHKKVKHTQTACRQITNELFDLFHHLRGWRLNG